MFVFLTLAALTMAILAVIGAAVSALPSRFLDHRRARFDRARDAATGPMPALTGETTDASNDAGDSVERRPARARPAIETYFQNGEWKNKVQGSSRAANKHQTKAAAVKAGREMAARRRVEHIIMNRDGGTSTASEPSTTGGWSAR